MFIFQSVFNVTQFSFLFIILNFSSEYKYYLAVCLTPGAAPWHHWCQPTTPTDHPHALLSRQRMPGADNWRGRAAMGRERWMAETACRQPGHAGPHCPVSVIANEIWTGVLWKVRTLNASQFVLFISRIAAHTLQWNQTAPPPLHRPFWRPWMRCDGRRQIACGARHGII